MYSYPKMEDLFIFVFAVCFVNLLKLVNRGYGIPTFLDSILGA